MNNWELANNPPPMAEIPGEACFRSQPVLTYNKFDTQAVCYCEMDIDLDTGELDGYLRWYTNDSETWNVTNEITHWMPLPKGPYQGTKL